MNSKIIRKWLRNIHRDLGYFFVGIIIIYGISGFLLNHEITAYKTVHKQFHLEKELSKNELTTFINTQQSQLKLNKIMPGRGGYQLFVDGGIGTYNSTSGILTIETYKRNIVVDFVHQLHYNTIKGWKYIADFLAVALIFFAISGLFLSRGKKSISGRGKWFMLAGIAIILLFSFL